MEKGYRHLGHDIGPADDPYTAGLAFAVDLSANANFIGAEALAKIDRTALKNRTVFFALDDPCTMLTRDETLFANGHQVGHVTSSAFGHTLGRTAGLGVIERSVDLGADFSLRSMGHDYTVTVSTKPFYDPDNSRMLAAQEMERDRA